MLPSARLAFSGVNFQETIRARFHGTDYEMLRTLKERFLEAEEALRRYVWRNDEGKRLANTLATQGPDPPPDPPPHNRRARFMAVLLVVGLERVIATYGWTEFLTRLSDLTERTAVRPAKPSWPRRLIVWLARRLWARARAALSHT